MAEVPGLWQAWAVSWALTYLLHSTVIVVAAWVVTRLPWFQAPRSLEHLLRKLGFGPNPQQVDLRHPFQKFRFRHGRRVELRLVAGLFEELSR